MEHYLCNFVLFLELIDHIGLIWANAHLNIAKMLLFFYSNWGAHAQINELYDQSIPKI